VSSLHCVVTGASGGIGEAVASILPGRGASVTLVARPRGALGGIGGAGRIAAVRR
jgi:short-subunit dehydrogenase